MNKFIASGNLGKDVEVRYTQAGKAVASFSLAVSSGYGDNKKSNWIKCVLWGKRAEGGLIPYLVKGQKVAVIGELSINEYNDRDGIKRTSVEVNIDDIELMVGKSSNEHREQEPPAYGGNADPFASAPSFDDVPLNDSDIPF